MISFCVLVKSLLKIVYGEIGRFSKRAVTAGVLKLISVFRHGPRCSKEVRSAGFKLSTGYPQKRMAYRAILISPFKPGYMCYFDNRQQIFAQTSHNFRIAASLEI